MPLSPWKANIKRCHCTGDVKGGLNDSLALVSSPEVARGFRYDPNHCGNISLIKDLCLITINYNAWRRTHYALKTSTFSTSMYSFLEVISPT